MGYYKYQFQHVKRIRLEGTDINLPENMAAVFYDDRLEEGVDAVSMQLGGYPFLVINRRITDRAKVIKLIKRKLKQIENGQFDRVEDQ